MADTTDPHKRSLEYPMVQFSPEELKEAADPIEQETHERDALVTIRSIADSLPYTAPELRQPMLRTLAQAVGEVLEANGWTRELDPDVAERLRLASDTAAKAEQRALAAEADAAEMRRQRDLVRGFLAEVHRSLHSFPRHCEEGGLVDRAAQILEDDRAKP